MTITFADEMKQCSNEKWQKILNHKFVIELSKGVLPLNKFLFYLKQDHYFLQEFAKVVKFAKQKTTDNLMKDWLESLYASTADFEMEMQRQLLDKLSTSNSIDTNTKQNVSPRKTTLEVYFISYEYIIQWYFWRNRVGHGTLSLDISGNCSIIIQISNREGDL